MGMALYILECKVSKHRHLIYTNKKILISFSADLMMEGHSLLKTVCTPISEFHIYVSHVSLGFPYCIVYMLFHALCIPNQINIPSNTR